MSAEIYGHHTVHGCYRTYIANNIGFSYFIYDYNGFYG